MFNQLRSEENKRTLHYLVRLTLMLALLAPMIPIRRALPGAPPLGIHPAPSHPPDIILEQATPEEKRQVAGWVQEEDWLAEVYEQATEWHKWRPSL